MKVKFSLIGVETKEYIGVGKTIEKAIINGAESKYGCEQEVENEIYKKYGEFTIETITQYYFDGDLELVELTVIENIMESYSDGIHKCSRCGAIFKTTFYGAEIEVEFCPQCGACLEDAITEEEINELEEC